MLTISVVPETGRNRFECRTCPYQHLIDQTMYRRRDTPRRERDDVLGGPGAWDNAQKEKTDCTREGCQGKEAAFFQVQIRSADEPMTTFFKVCAAAGRLERGTAGVEDADIGCLVHDMRTPVAGGLNVPLWRKVG